jgi:hypothetical protein
MADIGPVANEDCAKTWVVMHLQALVQDLVKFMPAQSTEKFKW